MHTDDIYEICVDGSLGSAWQAWFEGVELLAVRSAHGDQNRTILVVSAADPATLFGILAQIGALNLRLISVELRPA
jgi:hypothetical protein